MSEYKYVFAGTSLVGHDITLQLKDAVVLMNVCKKGIFVMIHTLSSVFEAGILFQN